MQELQLPTSHEWTTQDRVHGKLAIGLFEAGFALTVGNAYRPALLNAKYMKQSYLAANPGLVQIEGLSSDEEACPHD